jgi:hypothetical protein
MKSPSPFVSLIAPAQNVGRSLALLTRKAGVSSLTLVSASVALAALLALGWASSPFRLHPLGAAVWALVAAAGSYRETRRAVPGSTARFAATAALALAAIAFAAAAVALVSFAPCGGACI